MSQAEFQLGSTLRAKEQLRRFANKAIALGIEGPVAKAMIDIVHRLLTNPLDFGEQINNTVQPGGLIFSAQQRPYFSIAFAVYELERVVLLLDVLALPRSPLE